MLSNTSLPQVNFGHLTETASPMCYLTVTLSPFCSALDFNLDGTGKGKMVTENLKKLLSLLHTSHTCLVHLEKTEGFSQ